MPKDQLRDVRDRTYTCSYEGIRSYLRKRFSKSISFFWNFLEIDENFQRDMVDQNTDDWVGKIFFFSQMFFILISISSFVFGTVTNNKKKMKSKKLKKIKLRFFSILRLLSNSSAIQRPEKFTSSQPRLAAISVLCDWNHLHSLFRGSHKMT